MNVRELLIKAIKDAGDRFYTQIQYYHEQDNWDDSDCVLARLDIMGYNTEAGDEEDKAYEEYRTRLSSRIKELLVKEYQRWTTDEIQFTNDPYTDSWVGSFHQLATVWVVQFTDMGVTVTVADCAE